MAARRPSSAIPMSPGKSTRTLSPSKSQRAVSPGSRSPGASPFSPPMAASVMSNSTIGGNPANGTGPSDNCFFQFRSFVRVRPYKDKEGSIKPPDQVVPRPALDYNNRTLVILDPKTFKGPLKTARVNTLDSENILWSFIDPLETEIERKSKEASGTRVVPQAQADIYQRVVEPVWPSILEGYSSAFVVLGNSDTGKATTMFGDDKWSDGNKGIFPRFAEDLFARFQASIRGDTALKVEVSCVEIPCAAKDEKYIDLLNKKATDALPLRVTETETEGLILEGSARATCENPQELIDVTRKAVRALRSRKTSSYAITVHVCLTTTYKNLENPNAPPKILSRRIAISFSVLRSIFSNATFARCIDNAVERDTGSNSKSKPPTRDNHWTRLFADVFLQKYNVSMIMCMSPFFEHAKENGPALEMVKKLGEIKTFPTIRSDESEVEYRRLADEIHTLDSEVNTTLQTIDYIQTEIDRCHEEYETAATNNEDAFEECQRSKLALKAFNAYKVRESGKGKKKVAAEKAVADALEKDISGLKEETKSTLEAAEGVRGERQAADDRIAKVQSDIDKQANANKIYDAELDMFVKDEEGVKEKEAFMESASADYGETKLALVQETITLKGEAPALKEEADKATASYSTQKAKEDTFAKDLEAQRAKKKALDAKKAELAKLRADTEKANKDAEALEDQYLKKMEEKARAPKESAGCCVVQ